jgi:hypothetical protein
MRLGLVIIEPMNRVRGITTYDRTIDYDIQDIDC